MTINCDEEIERAGVLFEALCKLRPMRLTFEQFVEQSMDMRKWRDWALTDRLIAKTPKLFLRTI